MGLISTKVNKKTFNSWECPDLDAKKQPTEKRSEPSSLDIGLPYLTLMKEIKPVVTDKHRFHDPDKSFSYLSGKFGIT